MSDKPFYTCGECEYFETCHDISDDPWSKGYAECPARSNERSLRTQRDKLTQELLEGAAARERALDSAQEYHDDLVRVDDENQRLQEGLEKMRKCLLSAARDIGAYGHPEEGTNYRKRSEEVMKRR